MPKRSVVRKIEMFALHAHVSEESVDYQRLFQILAESPLQARTHKHQNQILSMPTIQLTGSRLYFVCYDGELGENALIYDTIAARERYPELGDREIVAQKTHGMIDSKARYAFIEYNHRGAKAKAISSLLQQIAAYSPNYIDLSIELSPVPSLSFFDQIKKFERIRTAMISVAKPNVGWDDYAEATTALAKDSNAATTEVSLSAPRGGSLSKVSGIMAFLNGLKRVRLPSLKNAKVHGFCAGEPFERIVSLDKNTEHKKVRVNALENGLIDDDSMEDVLEDALASLSSSPSFYP